MIPTFAFSEETLKAMAQAHQGPRKPPARWKRIASAMVRGMTYVFFAPTILFFAPILIVWWAFEIAEDGKS